MAMTIYSCDDHLDLWNLPVDLWQKRLPEALRERGPQVVERKGRPMWMADGKVLGFSGALADFSAVERAGIDDDPFRPSDPERRLADMDLDGITASVIYGPTALVSLGVADLELRDAIFRAFNDWAAEFNAFDADRLALLPALPSHSPEAAVAELERVAGLGHKGALISVFDIDCGDPQWEPLWAAAAATGLPLSFHLRGGTSRLQWAENSWKQAAYATVLPMQLDEPLVSMVFSGALERNPGFKLVLAESGIGWIPYIVNRMDLEFHKHGSSAADHRLSSLPSEVFRNQVWATFEEEPAASELIPLLGADRFMWASDYPHPDSTFPNSAKAIEESLGRLSDAERHLVVAGNCAALYGFA